MAPRSLTVRTKLALLFFTACALTFGLGGSFISTSVTNTLEQEILTRLELQSRAYAVALDGYLSRLALRAEDFASDGFVRDASERLLDQAADGQPGSGGDPTLAASLRTHLLRSKLPLVPAFGDLQLVSSDGDLLVAAREPPPEETRAWLASAPRGDELLFSRLIARESDGSRPRLALAAALVSRQGGRRLGWLVAWVNPSAWIFDALRATDLGWNDAERGVLHLLDGSGSRLTLLRGIFEDELPAIDSEHVRSGFGLVFQDDRAHVDASSDGPGVADEPLLRRFPLVASGWSVEVESRAGDALSAVAGLQGRIFGIGLLVAAAALVLFLLPMRVLTRPLLQLAEAARRIGGGDDSPVITIDSNDEIGEVGRSLAAMALAVQERTRVQERTAEDLRRQQGQLKAERDRLKAVIGSMRGGLIVLDPDGRPVVFNQAAEPILRALQSGMIEITSHHVCELQVSSTDACHACLFDPDRAPKSCQVEIGERTFEVHASQLPPDADGRIGRVLVSHDFTDRVNQDERMIHQERLAVLGEVAAVMAHELNNPLAAINMYSQMLEGELEGQPELAENVQVIQRNVESCKQAIRGLLDYATGATPEVDSVDIVAVLEDAAAFTRPLRERAGVEFVLNAPESAPLAWGDELQLRQIFVNLIVNAIQALAHAGGTVTADVQFEENHLAVLISDDGPGIPLEAQDMIFRPFFTTKDRGEGTGLGLPTARRIAEMHGGGVELLETGERGTIFRVRLMQQEVATA